jgi:hypothetical protein
LCPEESLRRFEEEIFLAEVIAACEKCGLAIFGYRQTRPLDIFLACCPVFGIVIELLVYFQVGSARQRPRTRPAASTFPLLQGDLRARSYSN